MSDSFAWDDKGLWHSCSPQAKATAGDWLKDEAGLQQKLQALADMQPLLMDEDKIESVQRHATALRALSRQMVVIGTGGASLGAQTLCALSDDSAPVRFLENCDPHTLEMFFKLPKERTSWCIISKSGETVETLAAALALLAHYAGEEASLAPRVRVITTQKESALGALAEAQGWEVLKHPTNLSGRFSALSVVGLLPAAYAGLDIAALRMAAGQVLAAPDTTLLKHAAWLAANAVEKPMHLLMGYGDRLRPATQFFKQLWAESLGKSGKGPTPLTAIGAIDQHSQLQLYLDGPRDKLITLWLPDTGGQGKKLPDVGIDAVKYLAGHRMGEVMFATAEATAATLAKAKVPLRVLRGRLSPETLAAWMMRQMLETLLVAALLEVDPYSQPAVEEGKKLTRAALGKK